ncbi:hypothetical protein E8E11_001130 [Didymella keratinophila]|nr:hypothetical protein E8E11_001130 [Didymella keratinophila]
MAPLWWQFGTEDVHVQDTDMTRYLNAHIDRSFAGTTKIMDSSKTIVENGKSYLIPTIPEGKPKLKDYREVKEIHPLLEQASSVSFCYMLSSTEGSSKISEWIDWQHIDITQLDKPTKLTVVLIDDNGFAISTRQTIYHRIRNGEGERRAWVLKRIQ